jgi:hypothetical protein
MKKILIPLAALILSVTFALAGTPAASADDGGNGLCASGPWGFVSACVQGPGWVDWNPGWGWNGGWHGGHHGEDGNSQGGD